jgi:hypothetical protein
VAATALRTISELFYRLGSDTLVSDQHIDLIICFETLKCRISFLHQLPYSLEEVAVSLVLFQLCFVKVRF